MKILVTGAAGFIGTEAQKNFLPMQPGDVSATSADTSKLEAWIGFKPSTPVAAGVKSFFDWYRQHSAA